LISQVCTVYVAAGETSAVPSQNVGNSSRQHCTTEFLDSDDDDDDDDTCTGEMDRSSELKKTINVFDLSANSLLFLADCILHFMLELLLFQHVVTKQLHFLHKNQLESVDVES